MNADSRHMPPEPDGFADALRQLQPTSAQAGIDRSIVFYQAGFQAGQAQSAAASPRMMHRIAAGLLVAIIAAPAGYLVGKVSALQGNESSRVASESNDSIGSRIPVDLPKQPSPGQSSPTQPPTSTAPDGELAKVDPPASANQYASALLGMWRGVPGARDAKSVFHQEGSLAAFHSSFITDDIDTKQWLSVLAGSSAYVHRQPNLGERAESSSSKTLAVFDAQEIAKTFEVVK